eukprot:CAMPEP_0119375746 /NCGR_PEP_ID=MMETSP1334-20130426/36590_1 /TAXON_ID=127549 /ORGANISM="Calcidiscus leptoporus, Strain RCC1130" /LENGTH=45 /DNA_ID= /DNA_START= /DNA_END= /DNA_ORIENTATION=
MNKWEVERRLQSLSPREQEAWRNGTWQPRTYQSDRPSTTTPPSST